MKKIPVTLLLSLLAGSAFAAEGVRLLPAAGDSVGVFGGGLTLVDSPSVTTLNPASLTKIHDTTTQVTYQAYHQKTDFNSPFGFQDSTILPVKHAGSLYIATPVNDTLTAGLGITSPFGISLNWPREGAFRYTGAYDAVLQTMAINPAFGLKINDDVSIGFGLDIFRSKVRLEQRFPWALVTGVPVPDGNLVFDGSGWGLGGYMGVNFDLGDKHHVAITGRLPVDVDYEGDFEVNNIPAPGMALPMTPFTSEVEHPGSIGIGYGYDVCDSFRIGFDAQWIQNSAHDDLPLNIGLNQPLLGGATAIPLDWEDSYTFGTGFEYDLTECLVLRVGYQYADSPMHSGTFNPSVPADDRHTASIGIGYTWGCNTIDLAYSKLFMANTDVRGNVQPAFNGLYKHDWDILTLSFTRRF